jgi:hypothetical protein
MKRQIQGQLSGVSGSWRTPIISGKGVQWIDLTRAQRDAEYMEYIHYLVRVTCAIFQIDPSEIGFDLTRPQQQPLFEPPNEQRVKASRDKGLRPLLRFIANTINKHVIARHDDHFVLEFVGLDELTTQQQHELRREQVMSYKTLNEIRHELNLPPIDGGDIVLSQQYLVAMQMQKMVSEGREGDKTVAPPSFAAPPVNPGRGAGDIGMVPSFAGSSLTRAIKEDATWRH